MRKIIFFLFAFFIANNLLCEEDERLKAIRLPKEQQIVDDLLKKISWSCSNNNFIEFIDCFTSKKASSIRRKAEDAFICGNVDMEVLNHFIISKEDDLISFGIKYSWSQGIKKIIYCSKIVLKNENENWKIDSEDVRNCYLNDSIDIFEDEQEPEWIHNFAQPNQPAQVAPLKQNWRLPNPTNGGIEAILPKDIMFVPGSSCAEGKCNIR